MKTTRLLAVGGSRRAAVDRFLTNRSGGPGPPRCPMPFTTPASVRWWPVASPLHATRWCSPKHGIREVTHAGLRNDGRDHLLIAGDEGHTDGPSRAAETSTDHGVATNASRPRVKARSSCTCRSPSSPGAFWARSRGDGPGTPRRRTWPSCPMDAKATSGDRAWQPYSAQHVGLAV